MAQDDIDDKFFDRADAHIHLSNDQISEIGAGKVSASMMYATARFNAWLSACGFNSSEEMESAKNETINYYSDQFIKMLEDNLNDYIENFDNYMEKS